MPNRRAPGMMVTSYSIPADLHAKAKALAADNGEHLSSVIRQAICAYIDQHTPAHEGLRARVGALADRAELETAKINATPDPLTGRRSTMRAFVLTEDLRAALAVGVRSE